MFSHLPSLNQTRVLVVGDVMLDRYWHGPTQRISPEAPVPVVLVDHQEDRPGGAANVALNLASLGAHAHLLGVTGRDETADILEAKLHSAGVAVTFLRQHRGSTISKLRVVSKQQQLIRLDFEDGFPELQDSELLHHFEHLLNQTDLVIFSDYAKGTLRSIESLIERARQANQPVLVDPKHRSFDRYRHATLITPNLTEFETAVGHCRSESEIEERGTALIDRLGLEALLITRSEQGMTLLQKGEIPPLHLPTHAHEVYDVTGAGDTVIAVLGAMLAAGEDLPGATRLANMAAGIVVGKLGTATITEEELRWTLRREESEAGILDELTLLELVQEAKQAGVRLVMTNGCFDILHAGHVSYLAEAKALGDRLIVAVNDDDSVRRLKGVTRPINTLEQRMTVLSALQSVDWVVPFSEDTPERLICAVKPHVLVKGADYVPEQIAGASCVLEHGGKIATIPLVPNCSTTRLVHQIRDTTNRG